MKYLLPVTLAVAAAWGAQDSLGGVVELSFAGGSTPTTTGDPPWLGADWPDPVDALSDVGDDPHAARHADPHAALYSGDDPHAGLHDPHAGLSSDDPHAVALGRAALLQAGIDPRQVARSSAENGHTIAEVHAQRTTLSDRRIRVRGTVVRRTDGILGKSFLHLWDGSAAPDTHADDLTVTTTEEFQIGETVEIEGSLLLDQDLGLGYRYTSLLDEAERVGN